MTEPAGATDQSTGGSYFRTMEDARREARSRRRSGVEDGLVTRVEPSPYGGFVVRSLPVDLVIEEKLVLGPGRNSALYADK